MSISLRYFPGIRGLFNYGLSCCINALLQSFSATTELFDLLNGWQPDFEDHQSVPLQLRKVLHAMRDQVQPAPLQNFLDCLHYNYIPRLTQHDADEVFHNILNLIQQQMPDQNLAANIKNLYKIKMEGQVHCLECAFIHKVPTFLLSLPLHLREGRNTLEDCIHSFFKIQKLEDGESFFCDRCDEKQATSQVFKIVSLPSILCIHLKRFRSVQGIPRKLSSEVTFPKFFNMAAVLNEENPTQEMLEGTYNLYAVIVHSGTANFGHYTAYIHSTQENAWYYANDSRVCQVSWKEIQKTYGGTMWSVPAESIVCLTAGRDAVCTCHCKAYTNICRDMPVALSPIPMARAHICTFNSSLFQGEPFSDRKGQGPDIPPHWVPAVDIPVTFLLWKLLECVVKNGQNKGELCLAACAVLWETPAVQRWMPVECVASISCTGILHGKGGWPIESSAWVPVFSCEYISRGHAQPCQGCIVPQ